MYDTSLATLKFGKMAKKVKNFVKKNAKEIIGGEEGKKWKLKWDQERRKRENLEREVDYLRQERNQVLEKMRGVLDLGKQMKEEKGLENSVEKCNDI
jgi:ketol-acid reductoisomerase